jgi:hypothetical protein
LGGILKFKVNDIINFEGISNALEAEIIEIRQDIYKFKLTKDYSKWDKGYIWEDYYAIPRFTLLKVRKSHLPDWW